MDTIIGLINSLAASPIIRILLPVIVLVDIAALGFFIFAFKKSLAFRLDFDLGIKKAKKVLTLREKMVLERWNVITQKMAEDSPEAIKAAIIEADNLVSDALKELEIPGKDLVGRLSNLELEEMESDEGIFSAHRLRRELDETPTIPISIEDGKKAIAAYEAFLKELGLLGEPPGQN